jgi:hypothetical protein
VALFHRVHDRICPFELAKVMDEGIKGSALVQFKERGQGLILEEMEKT